MMRPAELRRVPVTPRAAGQVRAGLRYIAERPRALDHVRHAADRRDHQLQLHRRLPALRREGPARQRRHVHPRLLGLQRRGVGRGAGRRPAIDRQHPTVAVGAACLGAAMLVLSAVPDVALAVVVAAAGRSGQRRLHDRHDRHRPDPNRTADDRPGPRHPDGAAHRHHARSAGRSSGRSPTPSAPARPSSSAASPHWAPPASACLPPAVGHDTPTKADACRAGQTYADVRNDPTPRLGATWTKR